MNDNFEQHVIDALARLETNMESLVGNGQPGRVSKLETKVSYIIVIGIAAAILLFGPQAVMALLSAIK